MQQRRLRLGDILDDYCPRERRITNHAVVAMVDDTVKQTRCTTCDADHEYKEARGPVLRRRKTEAPGPAGDLHEAPRAVSPAQPVEDEFVAPDLLGAGDADASSDHEIDAADADEDLPAGAGADEEGPVHRPLIRATLPRPEGQVPERKAPDFTSHQPAGRGREGHAKRGGRSRGRRPGPQQGQRQAQGASGGQGQATRFGGPPQGAPRQGARTRPDANGRGSRPAGQGHGPRPAPSGRGPKRGR